MRTNTCIVIVALSCASLPVSAQNQQPGTRTNWPCGGKVDSSYIRTAEATGGHVLLFAPTEVSGAADEMTASLGHSQTVLRASGNLTEGARDFDVPIDSAIDSIYFFVSVQCLESVAVIPPPGHEFNVDAPDVTHHDFSAIRLVTIKAPAPGTWRIGIAGRGVYSLIVKAKTGLALREVSLSRDGLPIVGVTPLGARVRLKTALNGALREVSFHLISMDATLLTSFAPSVTHANGTSSYATDITLPSSDFRVLVTGLDENGFPFERVSPRLFVGDR